MTQAEIEYVEEIKALRAIIKIADAKLLWGTNRVKMPPMGCDTPEHLVNEILELKAENKRLKEKIVDLSVDLAKRESK